MDNLPTVSSSHISPDVLIEGNIRSANNIEINSTFKGNVQCDALVTIAASAVVLGNVSAQHTLIQGTVSGDVKSSRQTYLENTGTVKGKIITQKLIVENGATYNKVVFHTLNDHK